MKLDLPADGKMELFTLSVKNSVGYFSSLNYINKYENYTDFTFTKNEECIKPGEQLKPLRQQFVFPSNMENT